MGVLLVRVRLIVRILGYYALSHRLPRGCRIGRIHVTVIISHRWVTDVLRLVVRCRGGLVK